MKPKVFLGKLAIVFGLGLMIFHSPSGLASESAIVFRVSDFFLSNHPVIEAFIPQHFRFSRENFSKESATEKTFSKSAQSSSETRKPSDVLLDRLRHDVSVRNRFDRSV